MVETVDIWDKRYSEGTTVCTQEVALGDPTDYTQHTFLYQHACAKRLTGHLDKSPSELIGSLFLTPPANRMLAIGAGLAFEEEWLIKRGYVKSAVVYEMSKSAVELATQRIKTDGLSHAIEMRCGSVLDDQFEDGSFDVVFVQAAIHHFFEIDKMYAFMHRVLKPGGLLIFDEYLGPDLHQYHPEVLSLCDEVNFCLAERYRLDALRNGSLRDEIPRATVEWMLQMDPSEGVHASRIMPLTKKWFDILYKGEYGGTMMRPFWVGILPNFDFSKPEDQTIARLIVLIEDLMLRYNVIPHYHAKVVAMKPKGLIQELKHKVSRMFSRPFS